MASPKKPTIDYSIYFLTVNDFSAGLHSGLNYKAAEAANKFDDAIPVFKHYPKLVFECDCFYPESHEFPYGPFYRHRRIHDVQFHISFRRDLYKH